MHDIQKMCRICLGQGSREIFEQTLGSNLLARDDLARIAEKLRFVTMLKVNPKENLPQQICDLCIVQLNVSYNFKRLALKNDFQIRQYMIENAMSLTKDDDDRRLETTTALEIHQIHHNVIRTNRYRQIAAPEIRRNSTTSSISGVSTMIINGRESDVAPSNNSTNNFVTPRPMVRPIQEIKIEPVDPDDEEAKDASPVTSSPSNSSEPASIVTVCSSNPGAPAKPVQPMVQINGIINNESFENKSKKNEKASQPLPKPAPLSAKLGRPRRANKDDKPKELPRNLRTIKKQTEVRKSNRKVKEALKQVAKRAAPKKRMEVVKKVKKTQVVSKGKKQKPDLPKPRGRPPGKVSGSPKMKGKSAKTKS